MAVFRNLQYISVCSLKTVLTAPSLDACLGGGWLGGPAWGEVCSGLRIAPLLSVRGSVLQDCPYGHPACMSVSPRHTSPREGNPPHPLRFPERGWVLLEEESGRHVCRDTDLAGQPQLLHMGCPRLSHWHVATMAAPEPVCRGPRGCSTGDEQGPGATDLPGGARGDVGGTWSWPSHHVAEGISAAPLQAAMPVAHHRSGRVGAHAHTLLGCMNAPMGAEKVWGAVG